MVHYYRDDGKKSSFTIRPVLAQIAVLKYGDESAVKNHCRDLAKDVPESESVGRFVQDQLFLELADPALVGDLYRQKPLALDDKKPSPKA